MSMEPDYIPAEMWGWFIDDLIDLIYDHEQWSPLALNAKLAEETGELAEHVLVNEGFIKKQLAEQIEGECADVVNCAFGVAIVSLRYMGIDKENVRARLYEGMVTKLKKYQTSLGVATKS